MNPILILRIVALVAMLMAEGLSKQAAGISAADRFGVDLGALRDL